MWIPELVRSVTESVAERTDERTAAVFARCFADTLEATMTPLPDGTVFVLTGDIPAMWLRDSTTQLTPYLHFAASTPQLADLLVAINRRQLDDIAHDPYANAFNAEANGAGHQGDLTDSSPRIWERKYEIDSLCYPIRLASDIHRATGRTDHLDGRFRDAVRRVIELWRIEQDHENRSSYRFERHDAPLTDTLVREGRGSLTAPTGMSWSAFRPSDDACTYGYNVPGNAFAATVLADIEEIASEVLRDDALAADASALRAEIVAGIREHAVVQAPSPGGETVPIYAYEVDGFGGRLLMDDANVPSLLSLPLLGWCGVDDPLYRATRSFILSDANPTYSAGTAGRGVGSPHTPDDHIWPIALAVEGLTSTDPDDKRRVLRTLLDTDAGTSVMHESFHVDDPGVYTRPWFSWANAMFCELVLDVAGLRTLTREPVAAGSLS
ncbi:glycoside hydrolase family 125 protein [Labedella populi]|uniref:Glycoside hydrolase family 125 protein n=2 Tax=Labedella populi TaxID=2498850 RepID=A0A3S3ZA87_9MICO|nr:glycoside hydrolase family 125 protein [Labedella populi]